MKKHCWLFKATVYGECFCCKVYANDKIEAINLGYLKMIKNHVIQSKCQANFEQCRLIS